ncbi:MAG: ABC-2 family transporter protein [Polyangiales bacterium]
MNLRFTRALFATVIKASLALRGAFLLQASLMIVNNLMFFSTWWLLFQRFDDIRGYRMPDMLALFGVSAIGFGVCVVAFGGVLDLSRTIADGNLDALLTQPKSVLLRAIVVRSRASGWGDIATGTLLLALSGHAPWHRIPLALLVIAISALVFVSSAVLLNSAAFWLRDVESVTFNVFHFMVAFTLYPPTLFGSGMKVVLFSVIPAALAVHLPVELLRDFHLDRAVFALAGALAYAVLAALIFRRGLARYASGNRFGVWG